MTTLTEIVATVVVHSSAAALSHFGVMVQPAATVQPAPVHAAERVIPRSPPAQQNMASCPKPHIATAAVRA